MIRIAAITPRFMPHSLMGRDARPGRRMVIKTIRSRRHCCRPGALIRPRFARPPSPTSGRRGRPCLCWKSRERSFSRSREKVAPGVAGSDEAPRRFLARAGKTAKLCSNGEKAGHRRRQKGEIMGSEINELPPREAMDYDVVIVGAGPAGLAAAIRLKQIDSDLSVVVIEKGSEPGAHILSGAVIDPIGLDRLLPGWRTNEACPLKTQVSEDHFLVLTRNRRLSPAQFHQSEADEQPRQFRGLARQCRALSGRRGGKSRRRDLPRFRRRGDSLWRQGRSAGRRDRRHGHSQGRPSQGQFYARHGAARQIYAVRGRRARFADEATARQIRARQKLRAAKIRHRF